MGGGDLNLKKSWHPHTMKNQEKVWKAEQAKSEEQRKLNDLRKEIEDEKNREELQRIGESSGVLTKRDGDAKLEWMYKNNAELINREEYLLGRTIDKSFETLQAEEQRKEQQILGVKQPVNHVEHECVPFSIRAYRHLDSTEQVDMQRKKNEDPLMLIKQREMESRRKLLENPVKLKELHRLLKTETELKTTKNKKSKKSKKKRKNHSKSDDGSSSSNSSTDSDNELDKKLEKRYIELKSMQKGNVDFNLSKLLDAKYATISKELSKTARIKERESRHSPERDNRQQCSRAPISKQKQSNYRERRKRSRSPDTRQHNDRHQHRGHLPTSRENANKHYSSVSVSRIRRRSKSHSPRKHRTKDYDSKRRNISRSPVRRLSPPTVKLNNFKKQLSEAEKEARRQEMMDNAAWRETDRTNAVHKHREAYAREEAQLQAHDFDKDFINKEVKKAIANHTSVGSRIRANANNIQRSSASMNSNFARK